MRVIALRVRGLDADDGVARTRAWKVIAHVHARGRRFRLLYDGRVVTGARAAHHVVDLRGRDDALLDQVAAETELVTGAAGLHEVDEPVAERRDHVRRAAPAGEHAGLVLDLEQLQDRADRNDTEVTAEHRSAALPDTLEIPHGLDHLEERFRREPLGEDRCELARRRVRLLAHRLRDDVNQLGRDDLSDMRATGLELDRHRRRLVRIEIRKARGARAPAVDAPERVLHDGDERLCVEGLGDRVDRAGLLHELVADAVALGAHENDRHRRELGVRAERATELVAVHPRHHEVEKNEVRLHLVPLERAERVLAVRSERRFVTVALENGGHDPPDGGAVVHDEDARGHGPGRRYHRDSARGNGVN